MVMETFHKSDRLRIIAQAKFGHTESLQEDQLLKEKSEPHSDIDVNNSLK